MSETNVDHIHIYQDESAEWRWSAKASNNEIIAQGESHTRREDAIRAAHAIFGDTIRIVEPE